jgi:hypothetical protein
MTFFQHPKAQVLRDVQQGAIAFYYYIPLV